MFNDFPSVFFYIMSFVDESRNITVKGKLFFGNVRSDF